MIVFNVLKSTCILVVMLRYRDDTLSTIGDAVCSFLQIQDPTTARMGVVTKYDILSKTRNAWEISGTCRLTPQTIRMYRAASVKRWIVTISA